MLKFIISNKWLFVVTLLLVLFFIDDAYAVADAEFRAHCRISLFNRKYGDNAPCWSCNIIFSLLTAFLNAAKIMYDSFLTISELILQLGGAIWLAIYLLKSMGSMAAQDPMKVLDGMFTFMFKWALIYALIVAGIDELIGMIISPILSVGFDIGTTFTAGAS